MTTYDYCHYGVYGYSDVYVYNHEGLSVLVSCKVHMTIIFLKKKQQKT